jgi:ethanolamine permease
MAIAYFAAFGRKQLILSPEEDFAVKQREGTGSL